MSHSAQPLEGILQQLHIGKRRPFSTIGSSFRSALEALWANSTRSFLTTLGIFIGVAAVIAAMTLTQGVSAHIENLVGGLGTNTVMVFPGDLSSAGARGAASARSLTHKDANDILKLPYVVTNSPIIVIGGLQVVSGNKNWNTDVNGVSADMQNIQSWKFAQGAGFSSFDVQQKTAVAVLGSTVYHSLFDGTNTNPIGKMVRIRDQLFRIVGVLDGGGIFGGDDVIYVPISTAQARLKTIDSLDQIQVQIDDRTNIPQVKQDIARVLRQNHHIRAGSSDDFTLFDFTQFLQSMQQQTQVMTFLLVGIAAISLTVGGIGIMNIMLVSVTERTREIGIRVSIGARRSDIRNQFLVEALILCLTGAAIGLLLGLLIGALVIRLLSMPFVVTTATIAVPVLVSIAITVIFGLYPAIQAARLDPVEALRIDE